jgi:hypothetical protein
VQAFEHQKAADELERTVASLQTKYEDFDANEVVSRALALGSTDLEAVYKQISFDKCMKMRRLFVKSALKRKTNRCVLSKTSSGSCKWWHNIVKC